MMDENKSIEEPSYVLVKAKGDMLYDNIVKLGSKEALSAAVTTAKALAQETAKPLWYRVMAYLEDKYKIKYG